ncbi:26S proteasome non-ATPase regulatory subunit 13-like [Sycon ciliatum]|uniref:26S proteasome non-ATPase regulatory subunit 13-like n=1 Tax=Sycon ciliatum TaxID=27933 RepID=UPI0020AE08C8|eukprot:scpid88773/ scgid17714/ 26S proteasome non-ATPase regulatory subunit 13; 26S proteasome regulatory subunit RPN9; 26S proteasome regulatory subunit S11; 26S proteasome regulatory subunit p40.5
MAQPMDYLASFRSHTDATVRDTFESLEQFYRKKLWHQLTLVLTEFIKHSFFTEGTNMLDLYSNFIKDFEHRINPLSHVHLSVAVMTKMSQEDAIEFLTETNKKVKTHQEASLLCRTHIARLRVDTEGLEPLKRTIEDLNTELDQLDHVTPTHGEYYRLSSRYYQRLGDHAQFYRDTLRYLGCINIDDLPKEELTDCAFALGIAALLGEGLYNFGEMLEHPIVKCLEGTDREWMYTLLQRANAGVLAHLDQTAEWKTQKDLASAEQKLRAKISLLALMEMVFAHPASERTIAFGDIATRVGVSLEQVELLVMKALSLGLVKGSLDEVQQVVQFTWVQPRVLDRSQIAVMTDRLTTWCKKVEQTATRVENHAPELIV